MKKIFGLLSVVALATWSLQAAPGSTRPDYAPVIEKYSALLEEEMNKLGTVGLSVALVDSDGVVWAQGFGFENAAKGIRASTNTVYGIGSMTKPFTAAAIMQLHSQGTVNIDKPLAAVLPGFKIKSTFNSRDTITLRQVLTHHAGIPGDLMACASDQEDFRGYLKYVNQLYATLPTDYVESYSNLGYCLLGSVIDVASKQRYEAYVAEHFFQPLEMKATRISGRLQGVPGASRAYDPSKVEKDDGCNGGLPAGGIYSSVADMSRFVRMWLNYGRCGDRVVIPEAVVREMFRVQNANVALDLGKDRGICWSLERSDAGALYSHGGALLYFRSHMVIAPECGLGAVILANSATAGGVTWRAAELVKEAAQIKCPKGVKTTLPTPKSCEFVALEDAAIPGLYVSDFMACRIKRTDSGFDALIGDQQLKFVPVGSGEFKMQFKDGDSYNDVPDEKYFFWKVDGQALMVQEKWHTKNIGGVKAELPRINQAWQKRVGKYKAIKASPFNWFNEAELKIQDGMPVLVVPLINVGQTAPFQMNILNDNLASVLGLGRYSGNVLEFTPAQQGTEIANFTGVEMQQVK